MRKKQLPTLILLVGFTLGLYKGYVALWKDAEPKPIRVFPCTAASLPAYDQQALARGIPADRWEDILQMLEDYLS